MTARLDISLLVRFFRDESGAAMVEFAMVCGIFFLAMFQLLDFGIFASTNVTAEKAAQVATRVAVVRPAACAGVPDRIGVGTASPEPRAGTSCRAVANACETIAAVSCSGDADNATANEIWTRIAPSLPNATQISNLTFIYSQNLSFVGGAQTQDLSYVGGPYVPYVTVELTLPEFNFAAPIGALAALVSGGNTEFSGTPEYRTISISLPGEDLALGTDDWSQ